MATLKIDFNCMCLFVTGQDGRTVHVLMPNTTAHRHHAHTVRLVYRDLTGNLVRSHMEQWALTLGDTAPAEEGELDPAESVEREGSIVNLSGITGVKVHPDLATTAKPETVISRVTILRGQVDSVRAQTRHIWKLKKFKSFMAHQVTFRITNVPDDLAWTPLGSPAHGLPLDSLTKVKPEGMENGAQTYALKVYHVLPQDLPPATNPKLSEEQTRQHFAMFYRLLGITQVGDDLLPKRESAGGGGAPPTGTEYCKTGGGTM